MGGQSPDVMKIERPDDLADETVRKVGVRRLGETGVVPTAQRQHSLARRCRSLQQGAELGQHALILWCAAIRHDLLHRGEDRAQGYAALAGLKPRRVDLSTVPNNDRSCRGRRSFSGRCPPHRGQRRRIWQCCSACA